MLIQVLAFVHVASGFWEYCITVWSTENTALPTNTYIVSTYSSVDTQNSCASNESLLLFFEVFVFPFPLNRSCQILFFWRSRRQINLSGSRSYCTLQLESHRNQDFSGNDNQVALKLWFHVKIKLEKKTQKLEIVSTIIKLMWFHIAQYSFKPLTPTSWK